MPRQNNNTLESIEFLTYPNLRLHCSTGVQFEASMNEHNRRKLDEMETFPELEIEDYNTEHGVLSADGITVFVSLERIF